MVGVKRAGLALGLLIAVGMVSSAVAASTLETITGESYAGQLSDRHILLESPWAGPLPVASSYVVKVTTQPGRVELIGGDVLTGVIRNDRFNFTTEFADITVEPSKVKALLLEPAQGPARADDVVVTMDNGDVVRGKLTVDESRRTAITLATSYAGVVNVSLKSISGVKRLDAKGYEVTLRDGSRVSGAILNSSYVLTTPYAELVIPRTSVAGFVFPK